MFTSATIQIIDNGLLVRRKDKNYYSSDISGAAEKVANIAAQLVADFFDDAPGTEPGDEFIVEVAVYNKKEKPLKPELNTKPMKKPAPRKR